MFSDVTDGLRGRDVADCLAAPARFTVFFAETLTGSGEPSTPPVAMSEVSSLPVRLAVAVASGDNPGTAVSAVVGVAD